MLSNISSKQYELPHRIQRALADSSLLFIGYRLTDLGFRVLFRGLIAMTESGLRHFRLTVQLPPVSDEAPSDIRLQAQKYLDEYFQRKDLRVYWGAASAFAADLGARARSVGLNQGVSAAEQSAAEPTGPALLRRVLRETLTELFSDSELRDLCFDLQVDYDGLPGTGKGDKARELILYFERRGRESELIAKCRRLRPQRPW